MGRIYRPKKRDGEFCSIWWVQYYVNGRRKRESTGVAKRKEAERFLKEREGRVATGQPILPRMDKILYEEIAKDLWEHYETTGERDLKEADTRLKPLGQFFRGYRVVNIDMGLVTKYIYQRQGEGRANGTINRELAMLIKMLRFGYERGKVLRVPVIHKLKEAPPRQGFFETDPYLAVKSHLPLHFQLAITIAQTYGWRGPSEILTLERRNLDLEAGTLRLDPGTTKNDEGRIVYLSPELKRLLTDQLAKVVELGVKLGRIVPYLFPHLEGRFIGRRIRDFRKAWKTACRKAGCPGMLRHDFRRTAVRNLVNAGVAERVAMTITGHRTRSVFDRYHIVSPADLQEATRKLTGTL